MTNFNIMEYTHPVNTISSGEDYEEYMIFQGFCPECSNELITMVEPNHPDPNDYPVGAFCESCRWQINY